MGFKLCGLAREMKQMRHVLTRTDVLNGSVICMDKQILVIIRSQDKDCKMSLCLENDNSLLFDIHACGFQ